MFSLQSILENKPGQKQGKQEVLKMKEMMPQPRPPVCKPTAEGQRAKQDRQEDWGVQVKNWEERSLASKENKQKKLQAFLLLERNEDLGDTETEAPVKEESKHRPARGGRRSRAATIM